MNTERIMPKSKQPRGPNGERLCRWCQKPVTPPRRTFCSDECVHEWLIRREPGYVRQQIKKRDNGICAICGVDTNDVSKALREMSQTAINSYRYWKQRTADSAWDCFYYALVGKARRSLWDADHITPVVEGGGSCGLENYRTLCIWCHKRETAELAKRRAKTRRQAAG